MLLKTAWGARCQWLTSVILATREVSRDQEDHSSKPAQATSLQEPISKKTQHKTRLAEWINMGFASHDNRS
jgi:hypothetical protein